jgi:hypothetical protein
LRSAWHKGIVTRARAGGQWHRLGCSEEQVSFRLPC